MMSIIALVVLSLHPASASHRLLRGLTADPKSIKIKDRSAAQEICEVKQDVKFMSPYREDEIMWETFFAEQPKCGGTVIETGGYDEKTYASSYFFEHAVGWKAILVESSPANFAKTVANRPDATIVFGAMCLGETTTVRVDGSHSADNGEVHVTENDEQGGEETNNVPKTGKEKEEGYVEVPCILATDVLRDHQVDQVDIFFLGCTEGFDVLQTIDWGRVRVDMFVVDLDGSNPLRDEAIRAVLRSRGYVSPFAMQNACRSRQATCNRSELFVLQDVWLKTAKRLASVPSQRHDVSQSQHGSPTTVNVVSLPETINEPPHEQLEGAISIDQDTSKKGDLASTPSKPAGASAVRVSVDQGKNNARINDMTSPSKSELVKQQRSTDQDMSMVSLPLFKGRKALLVEEQDVVVEEDTIDAVSSPLSNSMRSVLVDEEQQVSVDQDTTIANHVNRSKRELVRHDHQDQQLSTEEDPSLRTLGIMISSFSQGSESAIDGDHHQQQQPLEPVMVNHVPDLQRQVKKSSLPRSKIPKSAVVRKQQELQQEGEEVAIDEDSIETDVEVSSPNLMKDSINNGRMVDQQQQHLHEQHVVEDQDLISTEPVNLQISSFVAKSRGDAAVEEEQEERERGNDPVNRNHSKATSTHKASGFSSLSHVSKDSKKSTIRSGFVVEGMLNSEEVKL